MYEENDFESMDEDNDESNEEYYNSTIKDIEDIELLQIQSQAQLIVAMGYIFEYIASNQAIEIIKKRVKQRTYDKENGDYTNEEDRLKEQEEVWRNEGIDADKTAVIAATLELYGQIFLTNIDYIKLKRLSTNINDRDITISKTANNEIFIGAVLELIAYVFNYKGALLLYGISNQDYTDD